MKTLFIRAASLTTSRMPVMLLLLSHLISRLGWVPTAAALVGCSPQYFLAHLLWRAISLPFPRRVYERGDEIMYGLYQSMVIFFFEAYSGVEVRRKNKMKVLKHYKMSFSLFSTETQCQNIKKTSFIWQIISARVNANKISHFDFEFVSSRLASGRLLGNSPRNGRQHSIHIKKFVETNSALWMVF